MLGSTTRYRAKWSVFAAVVVLGWSAPAQGTPGALTQLPGTAGCHSESGDAGACSVARAVSAAYEVAASPDGKHVYAVSYNRTAISVFARNKSTGALTQLSGTDGCISSDGSDGLCTVGGPALFGIDSLAITDDGGAVFAVTPVGLPVVSALSALARDETTGKLTYLGCVSPNGLGGLCAVGNGLFGATTVTASPDGKHVYVASSQTDGRIATFAWDEELQALSQQPGSAGCVAANGVDGCAPAVGLSWVRTVAVSPDGKHVYAAAYDSSAVSVFARDKRTGTLTQLSGTNACVSETGSSGTCADGVGLNGAIAVAVSPDGKNVYAASFVGHSVAAFARDKKSGKLSQLAGTAACLDGGSMACTLATGLMAPFAITVSGDGKHVYVSSSGGAIVVLARDKKTGVLTQLPGTAGCVSDDGTNGVCTDGRVFRHVMDTAVTRDGKHVYSASQGNSPSEGGVAVFVREKK